VLTNINASARKIAAKIAGSGFNKSAATTNGIEPNIATAGTRNRA
jgi:hypothetical protein